MAAQDTKRKSGRSIAAIGFKNPFIILSFLIAARLEVLAALLASTPPDTAEHTGSKFELTCRNTSNESALADAPKMSVVEKVEL